MPARPRFFDDAFARYALSSGLATGTDFALASSLHRLGASPAIATFFGCVVGGAVAFSLSRSWTFKVGAARALPQLLRFLFVWATSALLNSAGVTALLSFISSFPLGLAQRPHSGLLGLELPASALAGLCARKAGRRAQRPLIQSSNDARVPGTLRTLAPAMSAAMVAA